jgi:hypothetical protein
MTFHDWRIRRKMKQPVRGTFTRVDWYSKNPSRVPMTTVLTGYVEAPDVPRTSTEVVADLNRDWGNNTQFPALVDREDPTHCVVLWKEVPKFSGGRERARRNAETAAEESE